MREDTEAAKHDCREEESPSPLGQASLGKEKPRRGARRKAITTLRGQPRAFGAGEAETPAAVVKSGLAGAMKEGPEQSYL